jgi:riboflavin synthase alpha subunit
MFTGIVEGTGRIEERADQDGEVRVRIVSDLLSDAAPRGSSLSVDGVCLTVTAGGPGWIAATVSPETTARTTLAFRSVGDRVNLERPLRLGDPIGGHLVQGHVDGVGRVGWVRPEGGGVRIQLLFPAELDPLIVKKGSIAVDGVSLTVAAKEGDAFEVAVIPETLRSTHVGRYAPGVPVNLEVDMLGRYVVESLRGRQSEQVAIPVTRDLLARHGFGGKEGR